MAKLKLGVLAGVVAGLVLAVPAAPAQAACKNNLVNEFSRSWGSGKVTTSWCYTGSRITRVRFKKSVDTSFPARGNVVTRAKQCSRSRRICLIKVEYIKYTLIFGGAPIVDSKVCVRTYVFGNGAHWRDVMSTGCENAVTLPPQLRPG